MPKVYEVDRGKPTKSFVCYPRWKCPRCQKFHTQPIGRVCYDCKKEDKDRDIAALHEPLPPPNDTVKKG